MGYIQELRNAVGNRPIILVGAAVLILDREKRLLMLKRTDNNMWGIPGGAMEPGESLEETARREVLEETNLKIGRLDLFDIFSGPDFFYQYPNGDQVYNVSAVYVCREIGVETHIVLDEHREHAFFDLQCLPETISPPVKPVLEKFKRTFFDPREETASEDG